SMRKEFEKLKEQFGVVNPKISSTKKALKISHLALDLKEFANKISFSFDCEMLEDSSQALGPHGHRGSTYSLEWSPKEYPGLLCLKNKLAGKLKSLKECPEYLQDYVLKNINFFVEAL